MRMTFVSHCLWLVVVSTSLAACSGSSSTALNAVDAGPTGETSATGTQLPSGSGPVAIDSLAHELAVVTCNMLMRCNPNTVLATASYGQQCVTTLEKEFADQSIAGLEAAIASGKSAYDGTNVRACLDLYPQLACDYSNVSLLEPACSNIGGGTVPLGGACNSHFECTSSGSTTRCQSSTSTCPGVCAAKAGVGQPCPSGSECQQTLKCDPVDDLCKLPLKEGDACGASNGNGGVCGGITRCLEVTSGQFRCANLFGSINSGKEGDICTGSLGCDVGLGCVATSERSDAGSSVVFRCQSASTSGGACQYGLTNTCPDGQYCPAAVADIGTSTAHCTAQAEVNQACTGRYLYECKGDARCANGVCVGRNALGGTCVSSVDCYSHNCSNAVCASPTLCLP